jgi:hypothetical protein
MSTGLVGDLNWGPKSGSYIRVPNWDPNWGPKSGSQIEVPNRDPNWGPKSESQIRVPIAVSNWCPKSGSQIGALIVLQIQLVVGEVRHVRYMNSQYLKRCPTGLVGDPNWSPKSGS